jgi:hypothetical protein
MLDNMIKKQTINSGRVRGQMNSTQIRQDGNARHGALVIKKTMSPTIDASNNYVANPLQNS